MDDDDVESGTAPLMIESERLRGLPRESEGVGSVNRGRFRMCPIDCWSVMHGSQNNKLSCNA